MDWTIANNSGYIFIVAGNWRVLVNWNINLFFFYPVTRLVDYKLFEIGEMK